MAGESKDSGNWAQKSGNALNAKKRRLCRFLTFKKIISIPSGS